MRHAMTTLLVFSLFSLGACASSDNAKDGSPGQDLGEPSTYQDAIDAPPSALDPALRNALSYMGNEERLAYDVYNALYEKWGTRQFTNIATKSEYRHIEAVQDLVKKYQLSDANSFSNIDKTPLGYHNTRIKDMEAGTYDIEKIQGLYDALIAIGDKSEIDALQVGCIIEVVDINDLDEYVELAEASNAPDVLDVFEFLRDGSYNHYWAFDRGLKKKGIANGCCALGVVDGTDYCHPEYPKNENGM